jgi:hypothetical protein
MNFEQQVDWLKQDTAFIMAKHFKKYTVDLVDSRLFMVMEEKNAADITK